jgi:hypothetical protein
MFKKSRTLAVAVATAGVIGFGAPMASAATTSVGDNGGWANNGGWSNNNEGWSNNGGWSNNNGGWSNMGQKHHKHHKQVRAIQICNNIIVINVIGGQKQGDPAWGQPTSSKSLVNQENNCKQFNG